MPTLKINPAKPLNEKLGLPWFAEIHTLMLCEDHISYDTWQLIKQDNIMPLLIGRVQYTWTHTNYCHYIIHFDENIDLSLIPNDLRDCIIFAAQEGYNSITFEPADEDGMQPIEYLKTYD